MTDEYETIYDRADNVMRNHPVLRETTTRYVDGLITWGEYRLARVLAYRSKMKLDRKRRNAQLTLEL